MKSTLMMVIACVASLGACGPAAVAAEKPSALKAFYFGNSFLENSIPWFHPTLAKSAGLNLELTTAIGAGWQIRMHVDALDKGNWWARAALFDEGRNAVVIQHFGNVGGSQVERYYFDGPGRRWQYPPRDVGDVASAAHIMELFFSGNPKGRAFIYNSWPGIPGVSGVAERVRQETQASVEAQGLSREEVLKKVKERKLTLEEMLPVMRAYDYAAQWLAEYDQNDPGKSSGKSHTRSYCEQLMEGLKKRFPEAWADGRLALIPNGDVFYALDKKMRAGQMPGIENVGLYSRDGGHIRAGLPRYTVAATCFAVMFQRHPEALDYSIYNNIENYRNEKVNGLPGVVGSAYVHWPDLGELLEITPERAKVVNDTIWEVVTNHPYTQVKGR